MSPSSFWEASLSRRRFLELMAASLGFAGLSACVRPPREKILPYVQGPEGVVAGETLPFATAITLGGYAVGLIATSNMGRPTKLEGNPDHPASLGGSDALCQAAILTLYDPDRSQTVVHQGNVRSWNDFLEVLAERQGEWQVRQGQGLRLLTETIRSPSLLAQIEAWRTRYPKAHWVQYDPLDTGASREGTARAFGRPLDMHYRFDQARLVVALDGDFFSDLPGSLRYAHDFMAQRRQSPIHNRLYVLESTPTLAGAKADHRWTLHPEDLSAALFQLAEALGLPVPKVSSTPLTAGELRALRDDLTRHRGAGIVLVGPYQPPEIHALGYLINHHLGNLGRTVVLTEPVALQPNDDLQALVQDMRRGDVEALFILGANPVWTAPSDLHFADAMRKVRFRVQLGLYRDETAALCHWHVPEAHFLESWGDARAYDGTVSLVQPLIAPLYQGKSANEFMSALLGIPAGGYQIVQGHWRKQSSGPFESFWRQALMRGLLLHSEFPAIQAVPRTLSWSQPRPRPAGLTLLLRPDPYLRDGRYANNAWLQELPRPFTHLTWDNAVLVSPLTAERHDLKNGDLVALDQLGHRVEVPVWILPGMADETLLLHLGYGRTHAGRVGNRIGQNAFELKTVHSPWQISGVRLAKTGGTYPLASTQHHDRLDTSEVIQWYDSSQLPTSQPENPPTLFAEPLSGEEQWGMAIDLTACMGCNACVVACQAENNIPVVGKEQVLLGREMQWLKIDLYQQDDHAFFQPRPCMHCENAPCELVCPVEATVHNDEGLNQMVYNRCIGTRYCSNNCPYKVRRFNFLQYVDTTTETLKMQRNPEVTVRSRGVMEKCTYCVQRIEKAKIQAHQENRPIRDGEVQTACQTACPTQAITFGNLQDPQAQVTLLKRSPLNYSLLGELNTRPRTTYLAAIRNPNPDLETP